MVEIFMGKFVAAWSLIPFSFATWFVIFVLGFVVWLFRKAHANPNSAINWEHLIIDSANDRASPYKLGYLIGVIVSTWIVITFANGGDLSFDILGTYLTFLLGGAGVNSYFKNSTSSTESGSYSSTTEMSTKVPDDMR